MQMAKRVSLSRSWGLNRSPHEIEPLYPFTGHNTGWPDAPVISTGRWTSASGHAMRAMCPLSSNVDRPISTVKWRSDAAAQSDRTLNPSVRSFPVSMQRWLFTTEHVRSCSTGHTQHPVTQRLPCALPCQLDRTQPSSVLSETDVARPLLPLIGRASPTETNIRSLTVTSVFSVKSTGSTVGLSALHRWSF
jgi:hypothetical protein